MPNTTKSNGTKPQTARVRVAGAVVQLQVFVDDGETLQPLEVAPIALTVDGLVSFDLAGAVAQLQTQVDGRS